MAHKQPWWGGGVVFGEEEEAEQFRFRFLLAVLANAGAITGVFWGADALGAISLSTTHRWAVRLFVPFTLLLLWSLWGRRERLQLACWLHWVSSMGINLSGLLTVPQDELRVTWFFLHLAGSFILLGPWVGAASGGLIVLAVVVANPLSAQPYSPAAMMTLVFSLLAASVIFWAYARHMQHAQQAMRQSRQRLRQLATQDPLTGLLNARAFQAACEPHIRLAARDGSAYALLFIDLDHFKQVNDRYGHDAGDAVLRAVAQCMRQALRASDVLGRIGGEEFCLFLPGTDEAGAMRLAEKLRATIEALCPDIGGQRLRITASMGVAQNQPGLARLADIQRAADQAMYRAKAAGRNRVTSLTGLAGLAAQAQYVA